MNQLRQRLFAAFAAGSIEELGVVLELVYRLSTRPKNSNAVVDFQVHGGGCKLSNEGLKLDHLSLS